MVSLRLIVCGRLILAVLCVVVVVTAGGVVVTAGGVVLRVAGGVVVVVVASPWSFSSLKVFNVGNAPPGPIRTAAARPVRPAGFSISLAGLGTSSSLTGQVPRLHRPGTGPHTTAEVRNAGRVHRDIAVKYQPIRCLPTITPPSHAYCRRVGPRSSSSA